MRKICIFTGTRAEYGLLKPLMDLIRQDNDLQTQIITSGTHLSHEFGMTINIIESDGFYIDEKIEMLLSSDSPVGISKSMGLGLISFSEALTRLNPDLMVILGDRFEAFAMASAAVVNCIPIAHIHGGESTQGAIDEAFRHSITKMSHIHFTATAAYKRRVIQLGEQPERVFNVGGLGIDNIKQIKLLDKKEFEESIGFKLGKRNLMITYHPVTLEHLTSEQSFQNLLDALDSLKETHLIFTKANADTDGRIINTMIDNYVANNSHKAVAFTSLGQKRYLSGMKYIDGVVGNSSSGLLEAPSFKIGTVNIGDRQKGRIMVDSVIHCEPFFESISEALKKLYTKAYKKKIINLINPYGDGGASSIIIKKIKTISLKNIIKKKFYNVNFNE